MGEIIAAGVVWLLFAVVTIGIINLAKRWYQRR